MFSDFHPIPNVFRKFTSDAGTEANAPASIPACSIATRMHRQLHPNLTADVCNFNCLPHSKQQMQVSLFGTLPLGQFENASLFKLGVFPNRLFWQPHISFFSSRGPQQGLRLHRLRLQHTLSTQPGCHAWSHEEQPANSNKGRMAWHTSQKC